MEYSETMTNDPASRPSGIVTAVIISGSLIGSLVLLMIIYNVVSKCRTKKERPDERTEMV